MGQVNDDSAAQQWRRTPKARARVGRRSMNIELSIVIKRPVADVFAFTDRVGEDIRRAHGCWDDWPFGLQNPRPPRHV